MDLNVILYCGLVWGRKFCWFLYKYDEIIWVDVENYYSEFLDIKFLNFLYNDYFIFFLNFDSIVFYCEGWKLGEIIYDGKKWNIKIKKD